MKANSILLKRYSHVTHKDLKRVVVELEQVCQPSNNPEDGQGPIQFAIDSPQEVIIHIPGKEANPLFDRSDILVNQDDAIDSTTSSSNPFIGRLYFDSDLHEESPKCIKSHVSKPLENVKPILNSMDSLEKDNYRDQPLPLANTLSSHSNKTDTSTSILLPNSRDGRSRSSGRDDRSSERNTYSRPRSISSHRDSSYCTSRGTSEYTEISRDTSRDRYNLRKFKSKGRNRSSRDRSRSSRRDVRSGASPRRDRTGRSRSTRRKKLRRSRSRGSERHLSRRNRSRRSRSPSRNSSAVDISQNCYPFPFGPHYPAYVGAVPLVHPPFIGPTMYVPMRHSFGPPPMMGLPRPSFFPPGGMMRPPMPRPYGRRFPG